MSSAEQAKLAGSGVRRLALGTVQFGLDYGVANSNGQVPQETARSMLKFAAKKGIDMVDTAIGYGDSEQVLGKIGMEGIKIVSKLTPLPTSVTDAYAWALAEVEASLARLAVDQIYGLLLHRSADLSGPNGAALYLAMRELQQVGKVQKIGISIYSPAELDAQDRAYSFDLVQAPFNLLDRRLASSGWLNRLKDHDCEVHVRSAFLQGLLLMSRSSIPIEFAPWQPLWDRWHAWLAAQNTDAVGACLAYPLSFPEIDRIVVGALDTTQMREIATAVEHAPVETFPNLCCEDEDLINPAKWPDLQGPVVGNLANLEEG